MKSFKKHSELAAWLLALVIPVFINPWSANHVTLCFFKWMGFDACPGCGLGKSIAFLYRGEWELSFQTHWLGAAAVLFLLIRIYHLSKKLITTPKTTPA